MSHERPDAFDARAADREAAKWLARRDRGLSAAEQDDYLQWLREDPRHAGCIARHEETAHRMRQLARWQPSASSEPNPDLFARPRRRWARVAMSLTAMAAGIALGVFFWPRTAIETAPPSPAQSLLRVNERKALADGSEVELRDGSRIEVVFSEHERRVRLVGGEAQFNVTKDAKRPFIVEAGGVAVHAIGTVFAVRLDAAAVDVLVTEGKVRVETFTPPAAAPTPQREAPIVAAQHRAIVSLAADAPEPQVSEVTPEQIKDALAWRAPRFQFYETPMSEAMAEFNRRNSVHLVAGDAAVGALRIGGVFRADNVEGFVSLLELTMGVRSERRGESEIALLSPQ
jgi:transmembrane sensor